MAVNELEKTYLVAWILADEPGMRSVEERLACYCFLAGSYDHAHRFFALS